MIFSVYKTTGCVSTTRSTDNKVSRRLRKDSDTSEKRGLKVARRFWMVILRSRETFVDMPRSMEAIAPHMERVLPPLTNLYLSRFYGCFQLCFSKYFLKQLCRTETTTQMLADSVLFPLDDS